MRTVTPTGFPAILPGLALAGSSPADAHSKIDTGMTEKLFGYLDSCGAFQGTPNATFRDDSGGGVTRYTVNATM